VIVNLLVNPVVEEEMKPNVLGMFNKFKLLLNLSLSSLNMKNSN
jgi:hypothetical protein